MDEIKRRANEYFLEFEGRQLYPKLLSWYWATWLASAVAFGGMAYRALGHPPAAPEPWLSLMFVSEAIFLVVCAVIGNHKTKKVQSGAPKSQPERNTFMDNKRRAALERICGFDSSRFAAAAKECSDLMVVQKQFRAQADTTLAEMLRPIYAPDSKARILALLLAAVGAFVALLNHSTGPDDFNILAAWADPGFMRFFVLMMTLSVAAFGLWIGIRLFAGMFFEGASSFVAISLASRHGSKKALNYFVRDLIRLHQPTRNDAPRSETSVAGDVHAVATDLPRPPLQEDVLSAALRGADAGTRAVERVEQA